ncbi:unnamed protein product [Pedinophyceae sp. YPF-701]|nr:unnamed protein product [Pedinophyceae sp. YPF-701]
MAATAAKAGASKTTSMNGRAVLPAVRPAGLGMPRMSRKARKVVVRAETEDVVAEKKEEKLTGTIDEEKKEGTGIVTASGRVSNVLPATYAINPLDASRPFRRNVYTFDDWARHRSSDRYWRHLLTMPQSSIVRALAGPTLASVGVAVFVGLMSEGLDAGVLPSWWNGLPNPSLVPFNTTGFALSLLLAFRTNSGYSRWWEARGIWGKIVNRSRDFTRQAYSWLEPERAERVARWMRIFPYVHMCHVREDRNLEDEIGDKLSPYEAKALLSATHRPNFVMQVMSDIIREDPNLNPNQLIAIDANLTEFADQIGASEKILKTPVPVFYTHHISRFLIVWLLFLPLGLWPQLKWDTPFVMVLISFFLLGIDEIGVQIEEPFGVLALEKLCATIEGNLLELRDTRDKHNDAKTAVGPS